MREEEKCKLFYNGLDNPGHFHSPLLLGSTKPNIFNGRYQTKNWVDDSIKPPIDLAALLITKRFKGSIEQNTPRQKPMSHSFTKGFCKIKVDIQWKE